MSIVKDLVLVFLFIAVIINYIILYKKLLKQRKYFIETLNHDLRVSTLAQFRGLELLPKNELVDNIKDSCKYTLDMISMLLNIYRIEDGENIFVYDFFSFSKCIYEAYDLVKDFAQEKGIILVNTFDKKDLIEADSSFLVKALKILFYVIIFHADKNSEINCSLSIIKGFFKLKISYFGNALTEEESRRMFSKNPRFSAVGQGIRMYLCRKIIEFHGGAIKVRNDKGRVNSFIISIPEFKKKQSVKIALDSIFQPLFGNQLCKKS